MQRCCTAVVARNNALRVANVSELTWNYIALVVDIYRMDLDDLI